MSDSPAPLAYRPGLDVVRAVAILLVVVGHWASPAFPISIVGYLTFFVLSGYFISGIVWKQAVRVAAPGNWPRRLGVFYLRRALRTLPPYYAALLLSALLPLATVHEHPGWFVVPAANLLFYRLRHWGEGVGHFWTLAVDEQFYLLWPLLLTVVPRRLRWLGAVAAGGVAFRLAWRYWTKVEFTFVLLPSCLDMLAVGGMLYLAEQQPWLRRLARRRWVVLAWLAWAGLWAGLRFARAETLWLLVYPAAGSLPAALTLAWALHQPTRPAAENRLLAAARWLGRRSYGCYLYHLMLPVFYQRAVFRLFPLSGAHGADWRAFWLSPVATVVVLTPLLLALAALSWHWLEAPLNRWKNQLAYNPA